MQPKERFLNAVLKKKVDMPAIGSATSVISAEVMDKVGIFFPKAHLDAKEMAGLAAVGHTLLGFDNVMPLFSVCHESAGLGVEVDWGKKNLMPSCKQPVWKEPEDIENSDKFLESEYCQTPLNAIRILKKEFGETVSVTGKVFGPWTLGYHLFGMEDFLSNTILEPEKIKKILEKLKVITIKFAEAQIEAGVDTITLGDHATRDLCSPESYRDFLMPIHKELAKEIKCPILLHICGNTADRIKYINQTEINLFHFDSKVPDETARKEAAPHLSLMGGTNNPVLLRTGTKEQLIKDFENKLKYKIDIIGPECAVPLDAPLKNLLVFSEWRKARFARG